MPNVFDAASNDEALETIRIPGKFSRRVLSELGDIFLTLLFSIVLYAIAGNPILNSTSVVASISEAAKELSAEANKSLLKDDQGVYINNVLSYFDDVTAPKDTIAAHYMDYVSEDKSAYDVSRYNAEILHADEEGSLWTTAIHGASNRATLTAATQNDVKEYMTGTITSENAATYKKVTDFYKTTYSKAWDGFYNSKPYADILVKYFTLMQNKGLILSSLMIASYVLSSIIFFVIVPLIKRKGTTVAKKIMHLEPVSKDNESLKIWQIIARGCVETICFCFCIPFTCMLTYGFSGFSVPFIIVGGFSLSTTFFFVVGIILSIASLLIALFRSEKASLHDIVSKTEVITSDASIISAERERLRKEKDSLEEDKWNRR